jgi:hypothetical protein
MATVVLPREMRERIKKEMAAEIDSATEGSASNLAAGILGVDSAGLAVLAGEAGGDTSVVAEVMCDGEAACATVAKFVERKRSDWANDFSIRLLGVGALIDHAVVDNRGTSLRISSHAPSAEAAKWLERVLELGSARHPASGPLDSAGPVTPRPNASSVAIVRAKSDGGDPRPGEGGVSAKH